MKKKIIVPVDFSACSKNAYWYARGLAGIYGAEVEVIHAFQSQAMVEEPYSSKAGKSRKEIAMDNLFSFVQKTPKESGDVLTKVKVSSRLVDGGPVQVILEESQKDSTLMIVMGNTGQHSSLERLFGSVSSAVAQTADCPVLLIPNGQAFQEIKNILYASNLESVQPPMLQQMTQMANTFRAAIHFIHVRESREKEDFTKTEALIFDQLFKDGDPAFAFNMATISSDHPFKGLNQYAEENEIDLIVLANRHRTFFETVMGFSLTQKMAMHLKYPLLVYHLKAAEI